MTLGEYASIGIPLALGGLAARHYMRDQAIKNQSHPLPERQEFETTGQPGFSDETKELIDQMKHTKVNPEDYGYVFENKEIQMNFKVRILEESIGKGAGIGLGLGSGLGLLGAGMHLNNALNGEEMDQFADEIANSTTPEQDAKIMEVIHNNPQISDNELVDKFKEIAPEQYQKSEEYGKQALTDSGKIMLGTTAAGTALGAGAGALIQDEKKQPNNFEERYKY